MKKTWVLLFLLTTIFNLNAQTWVKQNSGTSRNLTDVFFLNADTGWVVGEMGVILKTTNGGQSWTDKTPKTLIQLTGVYFFDGNTGWVIGGGGVMKTTDGGDSWNVQLGPHYTDKVFFKDQSHGWAVGTNSSGTGSIYVTTDGGENWTEKQNATWTEFFGVQLVDTSVGWAYSDGYLLNTTNGGADWKNPFSFGADFGIHSMFFIDKNTGFIGGHNNSAGSIYKTTNGGADWTDKAPGLQYVPAYIKFFDAKNGIIAGGAYNGQPAVLLTSDAGENWTVQTTTVPSGTSRDAFTSEFFISQNLGWVVGASGSILKYENTTDVSETSMTPKLFKLEQNYPNPFNPSTNITYSIPKAGNVSIKIFNILGKEVATLVNSEKEAGNYSIQFSADKFKLTSGIYYYQIKVDNFVSTKKMILMK